MTACLASVPPAAFSSEIPLVTLYFNQTACYKVWLNKYFHFVVWFSSSEWGFTQTICCSVTIMSWSTIQLCVWWCAVVVVVLWLLFIPCWTLHLTTLCCNNVRIVHWVTFLNPQSGLFIACVLLKHKDNIQFDGIICLLIDNCCWNVCLRFSRIRYVCRCFALLFLTLPVSPISNQGKVRRESAPLLQRRNSYTPLSTLDQVKRPRLYSAGNRPWLPLTPSPTTLHFPDMPEGVLLLQQNQVSVRT